MLSKLDFVLLVCCGLWLCDLIHVENHMADALLGVREPKFQAAVDYHGRVSKHDRYENARTKRIQKDRADQFMCRCIQQVATTIL